MRVTSLLLFAGLVAGCSSSNTVGKNHDSGTDAAAADAAATDAGAQGDSGSASDAGVDAGAVCGNATREDPEECDDGNQNDTDVCRNDCTFSPICGDGTTDVGEECDDGGNVSGDGCSGQCTMEACGNQRLDLGEVCDSTPGCATDCLSVTTCGNSTVDSGEQCDDGDATSWDGCSSACLVERAMVLSDVSLLTNDGCDLNGDGVGDSLLGANLQDILLYVAPMISQSIRMSPFNVLVFDGVADPTLTVDDPSVRIAWVQADDANAGAADFDGSGQVRVAASSVPGGEAQISLAGSIASRVLNAGPETLTLPFLMGVDIGLSRARIVDTTITVAPNGGNPRYSVAALAGRLCGIAQVRGFAAIPNVLGLLGTGLPIQIPTNSCNTAAVPTAQVHMADVLVGGASVGNGALTLVYGVQPDVDVDGDGLESYQVASGSNCQAVITGCVDGDGTVIPGHGCVLDPRMQDGWSAAFDFTAPATTIVP